MSCLFKHHLWEARRSRHQLRVGSDFRNMIPRLFKLNLGLNKPSHYAAFWGAGIVGLYAGQIAMHALLRPDERLPQLSEEKVAKLQQDIKALHSGQAPQEIQRPSQEERA